MLCRLLAGRGECRAQPTVHEQPIPGLQCHRQRSIGPGPVLAGRHDVHAFGLGGERADEVARALGHAAGGLERNVAQLVATLRASRVLAVLLRFRPARSRQRLPRGAASTGRSGGVCDHDIADDASVHTVQLEVGLALVTGRRVANVELNSNTRTSREHLHTAHNTLVAAEAPFLAAFEAEVEVVVVVGCELCLALALGNGVVVRRKEEADAERSAEVRVTELQQALVGGDCEPQRSVALACAED